MPDPELTVAPVDIRVLGPVRLLVGGRRLDLRGERILTTLAALAIERGTVLSPEKLGSRVWDDELPATYRSSLQNQIARIRAALRTAGVAETAVLCSEYGGYRLDIAPGGCDLHRFTEHRNRAVAARERGDHVAAAELFARALAQWSGDGLDGLRASRFADNFRVHMAEERRRAVLDRIDMDMVCGRTRGLVGELRAMAEDAPTGVPVWSRYITALYLDERTDEAADACRIVLNRIRDRGMDAPRDLLALQERILRHETVPVHPAPAVAAPETESSTVRESVSALALVAGDGRVVAVTAAGVRIGRGPGNDLRLTDPKISRRHAQITVDGDLAQIADLGSVNGVYVNDRRIDTATVLAPGDTIRLGGTTVKVRFADSGE